MVLKKWIFLFGVIILGSGNLQAQNAESSDLPIATPEPAAKPPSPPVFSKDKLKGVDSSARRELSEEELLGQFSKKKSQPEKAQVYLPLFYERMERALGKIKAQVRNATNSISDVEVDFYSMMIVLNEIVVESWLEKLKPITENCKNTEVKRIEDKSPTCWVPFSVFADDQVKIVFDDKALEIRVHVPPELRATRTASLHSSASSFYDTEASNEPSFFSSYININSSESFRSGPSSNQGSGGRDPVNSHLDSGTRFGSLVIEANARSLEKRSDSTTVEPAAVREDVRAVFDFKSLGFRSEAGDLVYPVKSFQSYLPMGGLTVFSQYSLQSSQLTLPGGVYEVYLTNPAKIQVFINDQLIQILELPAGRHNLKDIPFNSGLNDLRLEMTDSTGRTETKKYTYFSSNELLKPGVSELSYSAGAPWTEVAGVRQYDSTNSIVSLYHRLGISQYLTLGINYQANKSQALAGMEILISAPLGYFSFEPAVSNNQSSSNSGQSTGYAGRFRYVIQDSLSQDHSNRFTAFEVLSESSTFNQVGSVTVVNPVKMGFTASHSRGLSKATNINFGLNYHINRSTNDTEIESYSAIFGVGRRWFDGMTTNFNFGYNKSGTGAEDISFKAFMIWSFPKDHQFVTATHDSLSNTSRLDWSYQPTAGTGGFTTRATAQSNALSSGYSGSMDYTFNRARLGAIAEIDIIKGDTSQTPPTQSIANKTGTFQFATALVFAGGHFAFSRPVTDSFAILVPLDNIRDQNIRVNAQSNGTYVAETDWLGAAVDPELPSYTLSALVLDQKNLKVGTALPKDHFYVKPGYHSGYSIEIGTDAVVYLKMRLLKENAQSASMLAGVATYVEDPSKDPVTVFTNKNGLVRSEGFRRGHYHLEINDSDFEPVEFEIPESVTDTYDLGTIQLKPRKIK